MVCLVLHGTQSHEVETRTTQTDCIKCVASVKGHRDRGLFRAEHYYLLHRSSIRQLARRPAWSLGILIQLSCAGWQGLSCNAKKEKRRVAGPWMQAPRCTAMMGEAKGWLGVSSLVTRRGVLCAGLIRCATDRGTKLAGPWTLGCRDGADICR